MISRMCNCRREQRNASVFRGRRLLHAAAAPPSSRRRAAWALGTLLLALVTRTAADATRCVPKSTFSCCTQAVCSRAPPVPPCCGFLLGSEANNEATCAALGELFMNDWGLAPVDGAACYPGWYGNPDDGVIVDYANDVNSAPVMEQLAALVADYATVTTTDLLEAHGQSWRGDRGPEAVPTGWVAAAVGVHTDYCTFYGVRCDSLGRVITLCVPRFNVLMHVEP